jgi:hypothetical protein
MVSASTVKMKLKNSIHLEFCLCLLKDLFRNDSPITICSFNLQLSLLIETSTSQCIRNKIIKPNSNSCFSLGPINQPLALKKKSSKACYIVCYNYQERKRDEERAGSSTLIRERWIAPKHMGQGSQEV